MKIKYAIYTLLILGFGAFITYRIIENNGNADAGKEKSGKSKTMNLSGIQIKNVMPKNRATQKKTNTMNNIKTEIAFDINLDVLPKAKHFKKKPRQTRTDYKYTLNMFTLQNQYTHIIRSSLQFYINMS